MLTLDNVILANPHKEGINKMIIKFTVEHAVKQGREKEALELVRELNKQEQEFDHSADASSREGVWLRGDSRRPDTDRGHRTHLKSLPKLNSVFDAPAKIRVYLTAGM